MLTFFLGSFTCLVVCLIPHYLVPLSLFSIFFRSKNILRTRLIHVSQRVSDCWLFPFELNGRKTEATKVKLLTGNLAGNLTHPHSTAFFESGKTAAYSKMERT